jgi:hypothetical protein
MNLGLSKKILQPPLGITPPMRFLLLFLLFPLCACSPEPADVGEIEPFLGPPPGLILTYTSGEGVPDMDVESVDVLRDGKGLLVEERMEIPPGIFPEEVPSSSILQHKRIIRDGRLVFQRGDSESIALSFRDTTWTVLITSVGAFSSDSNAHWKAMKSRPKEWPLICRVVERGEAELFGKLRARATVECKGHVMEEQYSQRTRFAEGLGILEIVHLVHYEDGRREEPEPFSLVDVRPSP